MKKNGIQANIKINVFFVLQLFTLTNICYSSDTSSICTQHFLQNIKNLPWALPVDSAVVYFKSIGFDSCIIIDQNNLATIGPYVQCTSASIKIRLVRKNCGHISVKEVPQVYDIVRISMFRIDESHTIF